MRKKFLSIALALGLVASLGMSALSVSAIDIGNDNDIDPENSLFYDSIYYPYVPHGEDIDGVGPWYGTITVQNVVQRISGDDLNERGVRFFVFDEELINDVANDSDVSFFDALVDEAETFVLSPNASQTVSMPGLNREDGSGLAVFGIYRADWDAYLDWLEDDDDDNGDFLAPIGEPPVIAGVAKQTLGEVEMGAGVRTSDAHVTVDGYTAIPFLDVPWGSQSDICHALEGGVDTCSAAGYYFSPGGFANVFVQNGFDGHSYLPIVQTNDGWNTEIHLTNVDFTTTTAASVDVTLITTDQQGYGASGEHKFSEPISIAPGATAVLDVADLVGEEWVGSAHISSEVGIATQAYRSKTETDMLLTNTAAPSILAGGEFGLLDVDEAGNQAVGTDKFEQYAPLIFQDYEGWNTGISFVNNSEFTNTVTVTYYGPTGNVVGGDSRTISPQGQEFVYTPAQQDVGFGSGFVGSAVFSSDLPFHIAVDQVKYSTGEALSYLATAAGADADWRSEWPAHWGNNPSTLSLPLFQKANQDGTGDISGIQLFNANAHYSASAEATFYNASGSAVSPSQDGAYPIPAIPPTGNFTLYSLNLSEMSQGQRSSVVVNPIDRDEGNGQIVGVSNQVNYDVQGDGAVGYNMVNTYGQYRFPKPVRDEISRIAD